MKKTIMSLLALSSSIELRFWNVAVANRSTGKCVLPRLGMAHALSSGK
jgi:hypothetical protein